MVSKRQLSFSMLIALMGLSISACAIKNDSSRDTAPATTGTTTGGDDNVAVRMCRIPVRYSDETAHIAALEALVQSKVQKKETPTTMCLTAAETPLKAFDSSIRFEYEDNIGYRWVTFRSRDLVYSNQTGSAFRVIYLDQYGYTQLNATSDANGNYTGTVKTANLSPYSSYIDEIDDFLKLIKDTCDASPAKCMDPVFVTNPIQAPPSEADIIKQADDAFAGLHGAEPFTLGTVTFTQDDISSTLL